jgi:hypothetical protein
MYCLFYACTDSCVAKFYNICGGFMVIELWGFTVYSGYRKFGINFCCFEDVFTSNLGTTFTENIQKAAQIEPSPRKITKYVSNKIMFSMNFQCMVSIRFAIISAWSAYALRLSAHGQHTLYDFQRMVSIRFTIFSAWSASRF